MKRRCNGRCTNHQYYGDKGISYCEEWEDFDTFAKWSIENGYHPGFEIDRINGDLDYSPQNCRWVSHKKNSRNRKAIELLYRTGLVKRARLVIYSCIMAAAVCMWSYFGAIHSYFVILMIAFFILMFSEMMLDHIKVHFETLAMCFVAGLLIPYMLSSLIRILNMDVGRYVILIPFVVAFMSDAGAYFIGLKFGRHKLAPVVSPNKTIEGALGGVAFAVVSMLIYALVIDQLPGCCAGGVALRVQALLQILQSGGQLIGDIAQLRHDLDQRIDILHSGLVELVHDPLQAVPHIDQGLLDLRLVDHGNELVDALQKGLCLLLDQHEGILQLAGVLAVDGIADQLVVIGQLGLVLLSACLDLGLGSVQLGLCIGQLHVNDFQQLFIDGIDLFLIELHLHHPGDQTVGGNIGNAALTLDIGDHGVVDEIGHSFYQCGL